MLLNGDGKKKHSEVTKDKSFPRYIHLIYLHCALISSAILHHNVAWLPREPAQMVWSVNSSQNKGCKCKKPIENVLLVTCDFGSWRNIRKLGHSLSFANRSLKFQYRLKNTQNVNISAKRSIPKAKTDN
jgi:hypothetical protein